METRKSDKKKDQNDDNKNKNEDNKESEIIKCQNDGCSQTFTNRMQKSRHLKNGGCKGVKCVVPKQFKKNGDGWKCMVCSTEIKHKNNFPRHLKTCASKKPSPSLKKCNICDKEFQKYSRLQRHMLTHNRITYSCKVCSKVFKRQDHCHAHEKNEACTIPVPSSFIDIPGPSSFINIPGPSSLIDIPGPSSKSDQDEFIDFHMAGIIDKKEYFTELVQLLPDGSGDVMNKLISEQSNDLHELIPEQSDDFFELMPERDDLLEGLSAVNETEDSWNVPEKESFNLDESIYSDDLGNAEKENAGNVLHTPERVIKENKRRSNYLTQIRSRKLFKIDQILDSPRVNREEKKKILDKLLRGEDKEAEFSEVYKSSLIKYFKNQLTWSRYKNNAFFVGKLLRDIFGSDILETDFQNWLSSLLGVSSEIIIAAVELEKVEKNIGGRKLMSKELRQDVYAYWLNNSEVSIQRSNSRHLVKVSSCNIRSQIFDLVTDDENVELKMTKRGQKHHANRYVTDKTYSQIHINWMRERHTSISYGAFYNIKPFYVTAPTVKEMEMCLCSKCLNPHTVYKAIRRTVNSDLPKSLSNFLCKQMVCKKEKFDCHSVKCISGECEKCTIVDISNYLKDASDMKTVVSYYIFEKNDTHYFNTNGIKVIYKRTGRVDKSASLGELVVLLQDMSMDYLLHRYYVDNDTYYWKTFLDSCPYYVVWMDYSQNIQFTEKKQVQSAHYSGVQHTLHDIVIISPGNSEKKFVYHLSDDTNHDAVFTFTVIEDAIEKYPYVISDGVLILRSDNCQNQYKCRNTFPKMRSIAKKYNIIVAWFFSEAGHGRGIIDAMSSFGCKQPLKQAILKKDEWFMTAEGMCSYLKEHFQDDESKEYHHIDAKHNAEKRRTKDEEYPIAGSRSFHVICVDPEGKFTTIKYLNDIDAVEKIKKGSVLSDESPEDHAEEDENVWGWRLSFETLYELVDPGTFIGIRQFGKGAEEFYLAEVVRKDIAEDYIQDDRGHVVAKGDMFVEVNYLEKKAEVGNIRKRRVVYQRAKDTRTSFVNLGAIFVTNVEIGDDLVMDMAEYSSILQQI